jgi:aryl-alcohol dehydrogenase-like predicted oxidoreductase
VAVRASSTDIEVASSTIVPSKKIADDDYMNLGKTQLRVPRLGLGAWSWGDSSGYWGQSKSTNYGEDEAKDAYKSILEFFGDNAFIDTAEVYGFGLSEKLLGQFMADTGSSPLIATKFAPQPWRLDSESVLCAAKDSLKRLGKDKVSLYMQHWPGFLLNAFSNEAYLDGFVKVKEAGLADTIGVSNFPGFRLRSAAKRLDLAGIPLASNQVQYSLLYRAPEFNGVAETCKELGITLVAYSPLCQGLLTGKYGTGGSKPVGPRSFLFSDSRIREIAPLLSALKAIADEQGKTMAQVSLNWTICKDTLPIPGIKSKKQLDEVVGALGWRLGEGEVKELDRVSAKISSSTGAPFENW